MRLYPDHLVGVSKRLPVVNNVFPFKCDNGAPAYQLHCLCGREELEIWASEMPTVYARCTACNGLLVAYDLRLYPAASYIIRPDPFNLVRLPCGCDQLQLYISFEYPQLEEDGDFDSNNVSWCYIRCCCRVHATEKAIVNDETA